MNTFPILVFVIAGFLIIATLAPLFQRSEWWVRVFDFPRLQISILGLFTLGLCFIVFQGRWFEWLLTFLLLTAVVWQLRQMLPFTPFYKPRVLRVEPTEESRQISIMVANVLMTNKQTAQLCNMVERNQPDILLAMETDQRWEQALAVLKERYPFTVSCPQDNLYGMHLFSRLELIEPEVQFLIQEDVPSIHTKVRLPSGDQVMLHCLHPAPPSPTENDKSIERDAELITVAKRVKSNQLPTIVTGDLNDVAWSATTLLFRKISGLMDPRIGRGFFNTFNAMHWFLRWPLDHLFHSNDFGLLTMSRLGHFGSDHFPIFCQLQYLPGNTHKQPEPKPDKKDHQLAEQTLTEAEDNPSN